MSGQTVERGKGGRKPERASRRRTRREQRAEAQRALNAPMDIPMPDADYSGIRTIMR